MTNPGRQVVGPPDALEEWLCRAPERGLQLEVLQRYCQREGIDLRQLMDLMACRVVERYVSDAWSFAICKRALTALVSLMRQTRQCPDLAFAIFFAFCAGENPARALAQRATGRMS